MQLKRPVWKPFIMESGKSVLGEKVRLLDPFCMSPSCLLQQAELHCHNWTRQVSESEKKTAFPFVEKTYCTSLEQVFSHSIGVTKVEMILLFA